MLFPSKLVFSILTYIIVYISHLYYIISYLLFGKSNVFNFSRIRNQNYKLNILYINIKTDIRHRVVDYLILDYYNENRYITM